MGTVFNDAAPLRAVLDALAALPVDVLATVGPDGDLGALVERPGNVRVERYVPQTRVLHRCAVVVSHGGSGTVLGALAAGVAQLCLPQGADQFLNAEAVAARGAGLALAPGEVTPVNVTEAVARLLDDPSSRQAAQAVAEEIAAMPSPEEVAADLEALV
jgi:MGT family glycosyltransferase